MELKLLGAAIGALMTCAPAHAATFLFTLNGPPYAEFELDSAVPPSSFDDTRSNFTGVVGTFDRMSGSASVSSASVSFGLSRLQIVSPNLGNVQFVSSGPLFTGPTGSPTFLEGTFQLFNVAGGRAELRVTSIRAAVPEPATWAMMIGGFGMVGGAMRSARRKQTVSVRYA